MAPQPIILKLVLIGDGGVGKSSVMNRFITGQFDSQSYHTIGKYQVLLVYCIVYSVSNLDSVFTCMWLAKVCLL